MAPVDTLAQPGGRRVPVEERESVTIRLAGDSGDGMQLAGTQFTHTSALFGNDISTLPDFPAEIRAPGDHLNTLVAMNPAALKTNLKDLEPGGILIVNKDAFNTGDLHKAGYKSNPLEDGSLEGYRVHAVPVTTLNR